MAELLLIAVLVVVAAVLVVLAIAKMAEKRKYVIECRAESEKWQEEKDRELAEWNKKLASAKYLLAGSDWSKKDGKEAFIKEVLGEEIPKYLWYLIGERELADYEIQGIVEFFYPSGWRGMGSFGDIEYHNKKLRIRNAERFTDELLGCPLVQVGYSYFGVSEVRVINFQDGSLYDTALETV